MKNNELVRKVEDFIIDEFGSYVESVGSKVLLGRIWGLLITKHEPMSLSNISERLGVSKPAISNTISIGVHLGIFKKVYMQEYPREFFYVMNVEFLEMVIDPGIKKLSVLIDKFKKAGRMIENEGEITDEELKMTYERVDFLIRAFEIVLEEYHRFGDVVKERIRELHKQKRDTL